MVNTQPAEQRGLRYDSLFLLFPFRLTPPPGCAFLICYLRITTLPPWEDHVTGIRRVGGLHTQQTWKDISCSSWLTVLYWLPAAFAKSRSTTTTVALRIMTFFRAISAWVPWAPFHRLGGLCNRNRSLWALGAEGCVQDVAEAVSAEAPCLAHRRCRLPTVS